MTDFGIENRKSISDQRNDPENQRAERVTSHRTSYTIERSYCEIVQKNKPQSNSVVGGEMIFLMVQSVRFINNSILD